MSAPETSEHESYAALSAPPAAKRSLLSRLSAYKEAFLSLIAVLAAWQIASLFFADFLFPPLTAIGAAVVDLVASGGLWEAAATFARILSGMAGAFLFGGLLAVLMARSGGLHRGLYPIVNLLQGVPALSWVVIAIIWFQHTEFRIWFIMCVTTLPAFTFQLLDAYRSIPNDLAEMTMTFRPKKRDYFRVLVAPALVPGVLTAWKVNLGNASRVVVVAELVGATSGVGYQLLQSQQLFDMAAAISWTLTLVVFVLLMQGVLSILETYLLRYRPQSERVT